MKRRNLGWVLFSLANTAIVFAQPPAPHEGGPRPGGPGGRPPLPIVEAIDKDKDHELSAEEIKAAVEALLTLDKNSDGKLTEDEYLPPRRGPEGDGPEGRGPGGPEGRGPGGRGPGGPEGRGPGGFEGRGPGGFEGRGPGGPEGRGPGGFEGRGPGHPEAGGPPPNPERFVEHAMEFDADGDGKLSREELMKFAMQMPNHRPGGMGPGGPGGMGPGGPGREGGPRGRQGGERPAPPRGDRPELE